MYKDRNEKNISSIRKMHKKIQRFIRKDTKAKKNSLFCILSLLFFIKENIVFVNRNN